LYTSPAVLIYYRSAAQLSYQDAQNVIDGKTLTSTPVVPDHDASAIEHDIKVLDDLARKLHAQRKENGTLSLESLRLEFVLDDKGMPEDCWQHENTEANSLIREVRTFSLHFRSLLNVRFSS
jgi:protein SSD1